MDSVATPRGLPQEHVRRTESPRRRLSPQAPPPLRKKVEPCIRVRASSRGARPGPRGTSPPRAEEPTTSPRPGAATAPSPAARSPRDDRLPSGGVAGHERSMPGRGNSVAELAADAGARIQAPRNGAEEAAIAGNVALRLQRELEEGRRENMKLNDKLAKARLQMQLLQRQGDEARAERDREHLRAESLQKSSQQLMRQLKRETAKVHLLERHLSAASRGEQWRHNSSASFDAAVADTFGDAAERGAGSRGAPDLVRSLKEPLSSASLHVSEYPDGGGGAHGVGGGAPAHYGEWAQGGGGAQGGGDACGGGVVDAAESAHSDVGESSCNGSIIGVTAAEAAGGFGVPDASTREASQQPPECLSKLTPRSGAGKLPDTGFVGDSTSGLEMHRSWEFVVQGQHDPARQQDFASKIVSCYPDDAVERALKRGVACVCSRGRRLDRSVPNQDDFVAARHTLVHGGHIALYGVFDGHGPAGHHCAAFARGALPESLFGQRTLLLRPEDTLREAFRQTQASLLEQPFDTEHSGTTAALALVLSLPAPLVDTDGAPQEGEAWLFVAHVGDSRAILASHRPAPERGGEPSAFTVTALTRDHRPDDAEEAERIQQSGGDIRKLRENTGAARVFARGQDRPGLALTRTLGAAAAADCGVTAEPEVSAYRLRPGVDVLLVLGTDGLFEFCSNTNAAGHILKEGVTTAALKSLCGASRRQWAQSSYNETVDDITAIAAALPPDHLSVGQSAAPPPAH